MMKNPRERALVEERSAAVLARKSVSGSLGSFILCGGAVLIFQEKILAHPEIFSFVFLVFLTGIGRITLSHAYLKGRPRSKIIWKWAFPLLVMIPGLSWALLATTAIRSFGLNDPRIFLVGLFLGGVPAASVLSLGSATKLASLFLGVTLL
ncbi:MAG: hypothetical protein JNM63_01715, partial [Spirochaetia bacterium]|nr:hypothetical protein [Spirochaetia bacterium]